MRREEITSRQNAAVKHLRALSKSREERYRSGEFFCDGEKLFFEAVSENAPITAVLCTAEFEKNIPQNSAFDLYIAPKSVIESVTTMKSAPDVVFSCRIKESAPEKIECAVLLDGLQDTGNVGTIIRTADAFGISAVFEDGCADIYNPKTIRSAMGSLFRVAVVSCNLIEKIPELQRAGIRVYASELHKNSKEISECGFKSAAVVIGNEGNGVRSEVSALCDESVIIPMRGGAESLNAAVSAAIFMQKMSER